MALFFALLPAALRDACQITGIEYDPVTARIARLVHPQARVRCEDYARSKLSGSFDLAIGNPPYVAKKLMLRLRAVSHGSRRFPWLKPSHNENRDGRCLQRV